jgi:eukaryotic-like serine/threonine-protein kinase
VTARPLGEPAEQPHLELHDLSRPAGSRRSLRRASRYPGRTTTRPSVAPRPVTVEVMASTTDRRVGGRYELVRRIARGGGGTVWAAYDHLLERDVAVKHVPIPDDLPATERELVRARVRSEARAAARLLHPSAVTIFDVVAEDGDVHLVLELVEDPTLDELVMRQGPLDEAEAAAVGRSLLDVLMAAHERGIVHRDVKPSNIFVADTGEVKLTDFGIASMDGEARLTRTGATMGSPQFIAPEQALGHDAAPAADLWGLGASLYLAVEGVPPFQRGNAIATVHAVVHEDARPCQRADELAPDPRGAAESRTRRTAPPRRGCVTSSTGSPANPPAVPAASTPVVPIRSTPSDEAPPEAEPTPEATGPSEPDDGDGEAADDTLSASVPLRTAAPDDDDAARTDAEPTSDPDEAGRRRWLPALVVAALAGLVAIALLTGGGPDLDPDGPEVAAPDASEDEDAGGDADPEATDPGASPGEDPDADPEGGDGPRTRTPRTIRRPRATRSRRRTCPTTGRSSTVPPTRWPSPPVGRSAPARDAWSTTADPDSSTYLRVDWTPDPQPDPYANWEEFDRSLAASFDNYERLQLTELTFRGEPAALLEYTYTAGGTELRAYNLNLLSGDRAYALNLQSQAQDWDEVEPMFASMVGGFQPD